ncbi:MAG: IS630 family transposase [Blastocatellia bacterium]
MLHFRITISATQRKSLELKMKSARQKGDLRTVLFILVIQALVRGLSSEQVAMAFSMSAAQVESYAKKYLCYGVAGVAFKQKSGRPSKLTKDQRRQLEKMIEDGPQKAGFAGACWRSPMIQDLIQREFGVFYSVFYIAELMRNLGFTFQKAMFVSAHLKVEERKRWQRETWPRILREARQRQAMLLFGDEASFPQWGTLSYTWARPGQQPQVLTSGKRKGWKVFGLMDYFSGAFFYRGQEGRLNSAAYIAFLTEVLAKTTRHLFLIQDGASYHRSKETRAFFAHNAARLTVWDLPGYSPDYNPIEKLWKKIKQEETHMHYFPTFESLSEKVEEALLKFADAPGAILALCGLPEELAWAV